MEDGWERRHPPLDADSEQVAGWLAPVCPGARVLRIERLSGGLCNTNLAVRLQGSAAQRVVVRLYQRDPAACRREAAIHRRLAGRLPLAGLLHAEPEPTTGPARAIFGFVPGERLADALPRLDGVEAEGLANAAGEALAAIHRVPFPRPGFLDAEPLHVAEPMPSVRAGSEAYLGELLAGRAGQRLGSELRHAVQSWCRARLSRLDALNARVRLVHADYKPTNLLVSRNARGWGLRAVLDWEFALAFTPLIDLGQFLRYEEELPSGFARAFAAGYRAAGGELPAGWRSTARLLDLLNLLGFLASEDERPQVHATSRRLIARTIELEP